jgi:hypothetical protein
VVVLATNQLALLIDRNVIAVTVPLTVLYRPTMCTGAAVAHRVSVEKANLLKITEPALEESG